VASNRDIFYFCWQYVCICSPFDNGDKDGVTLEFGWSSCIMQRPRPKVLNWNYTLLNGSWELAVDNLITPRQSTLSSGKATKLIAVPSGCGLSSTNTMAWDWMTSTNCEESPGFGQVRHNYHTGTAISDTWTGPIWVGPTVPCPTGFSIIWCDFTTGPNLDRFV